MAGSAQEADDLLQEIFLHVHRKLSSFRGDSSLGTWLYRLGMNHCLDYEMRKGNQEGAARIVSELNR
ncbi:MAG TPA: sigma factor [Vicinamibacterales bacterium]